MELWCTMHWPIAGAQTQQYDLLLMTAITLSPPWHYDLLHISPSAMTRCTDNRPTCCWQQPLQPPGYSLSRPVGAGRPIYGPPGLLLHACHPLDASTTLGSVHMPYNVTVATRHSWHSCCMTHLPPPLRTCHPPRPMASDAQTAFPWFVPPLTRGARASI